MRHGRSPASFSTWPRRLGRKARMRHDRRRGAAAGCAGHAELRIGAQRRAGRATRPVSQRCARYRRLEHRRAGVRRASRHSHVAYSDRARDGGARRLTADVRTGLIYWTQDSFRIDSEAVMAKAAGQRKSEAVSKAAVKSVTDAERQRDALDLRKQGYTFQEIADRIGYRHASGAHQAVMAGLRKTIQEPADELRRLELERL